MRPVYSSRGGPVSELQQALEGVWEKIRTWDFMMGFGNPI